MVGSAGTPKVPVLSLPNALNNLEALSNEIVTKGRQVVFFLDFDGTLAPIVPNPEAARMPTETKAVLVELAKHYPISIVTGRALATAKRFVNMNGIMYAGSHGFHIEIPTRPVVAIGKEVRPQLEGVYKRLSTVIQMAPGATIEDNMFSISVHYRHVSNAQQLRELEDVVEAEVKREKLRLHHGKMVWEIRPEIEWNKGKAVEYLIEQLGMDSERFMPVYIGDDVTDEDAFSVLPPYRGLGVVVYKHGDNTKLRDTSATLRLEDPIEVRKFLEHFLTHEGMRTCGAEAKMSLPVRFGDVARNGNGSTSTSAAP